MSTAQETLQATLHLQNHGAKESLMHKVAKALILSEDRAIDSVQSDGHWCGELKSNVTITAEYIFLRQAFSIDLNADGEALRHYLLSQQNDDGSWGLAPTLPGDLSTTAEAYLALKILKLSIDAIPMQRARDFVLKAGGIAAVRVFTRIYFATFGLFPWEAVPQLPVELVLLPAMSPINIYALASWARSTIMPLLIICHHRPTYALPNGKSAQNDFLDELWCEASNKSIPYAPSLYDLFWEGDACGFAFTAVDKILGQLGGLRAVPLLRSYARRQCVRWILEHQEPSGDWAGIFSPMHAGIYALTLEGFKLDDPPVRLGLEALERFAIQDHEGKRIQPCVSPVWDTVLMSIALCDVGMSLRTEHLLAKAVSWTKARQLLGPEGDWRIYRPQLSPGGFSFEYINNWYPDVDDTAAAILAFVKQDVASVASSCVVQSAEWILGMQNSDGGWAAFDVKNDKLFLNKIPFSDMDSLSDPSSPDIAGRVLEAFGLMIHVGDEKHIDWHLLNRLKEACAQAITYLVSSQEENGAWYGRWGSNYIYGTSNSLCGLAYFKDDDSVQEMVQPALQWLKSRQNDDGGWGETLLSYKDPEKYGPDRSTPSQTAWALMGLLAHLPHTDDAIDRGVRYLISSQTDRGGGLKGASWPETVYTGTGFPNHFYLGYTMYRHYFPIMALGRYLQSVRRSG